ncbi:hypothetical protein JX265_010065 [Neoarthrinium moseri]|uniref:Uncharacterized protein n=1 Tax=Neoarthrinium moseri TaxID=1658444 RepID=A0A9P9WEZ9_9PEZI|nr:uncharacterized protein JN550_006896 [Neoarthrinium moseri]KAI1844441.1 hypothetical protein JX266_009328 [Neoarthrinium moseri]KAI1860141.1 hypothetical protein JX265_010065 [Neoarthrinium moseri]KAI1867755.1 hypothetical protein JN550_006896 [Neoarthrinium moseri]
MPQFVFIELPGFRVKDASGHTVSLGSRDKGLMVALYHYVRSGIRTVEYCDLSASLLFAGGEPDLWTSSNTAHGLHAEENMLFSYFQSFDSPGAYPIVDALLLSHKPCSNCMNYFTQSGSGQHLKPGGGIAPFRAKFTPRSDRQYTPVFYIERRLDAAQRADLWFQLGNMWAAEFGDVIISSPEVARGHAYWVMQDSPWYAINDQENMSDAEIVQAIQAQGAIITYWIGR